MHDAATLAPPPARERRLRLLLRRAVARSRAVAPSRTETAMAVASALLLIVSFPDFNLWPLSWVGLVPLVCAVARRRHPPTQTRAFIMGWLAGTLFFFGSCYWLSYAMIRYGGIPSAFAYLLLVPGAIILGLFPATFCLTLRRAVARWGLGALFIAPFVWAALEWGRLFLTGQLWNAIGYSHAFTPTLIQAARWGGVYAVGFLIVTVNIAIAYALMKRTWRSLMLSAVILVSITFIIFWQRPPDAVSAETNAQGAEVVVVAIQPNVPMEPVESVAEMEALFARHVALSERALGEIKDEGLPRVVIWPESPMYFMYGRDTQLREMLAAFTTRNRTSIIFNSLEAAPANGAYNSAVLINAEGRLAAQYDKIRLLPFGEYVPLPRWLPGVNLVPTVVGDFTPGAQYPLLPLGGEARAGVFICFESAFPSVARTFAHEGADVLINISNDGYLGPTPVMKQHLANAVLRAVENDRPVLRVTNTGISAYITERGEVRDATAGFQMDTRTWTVRGAAAGKTFYTRRGDLFAGLCALVSVLALLFTFINRRFNAD